MLTHAETLFLMIDETCMVVREEPNALDETIIMQNVYSKIDGGYVGSNAGSMNIIDLHDGAFSVIKCGRGEWTAATLEDAKQMAMDFAESVS